MVARTALDLSSASKATPTPWLRPCGAWAGVIHATRPPTAKRSLRSGTLSATITANVRYDGITPTVGGRGIIEQAIPYKCIASGTLDSTAIQVVIKNNDATA